MTVTDDVACQLVRLPLYYGMTEEQQDRVVEAVYDFYKKQ
jgi:dTDP-4-amino-4,6-dideoxygalactose transaminase